MQQDFNERTAWEEAAIHSQSPFWVSSLSCVAFFCAGTKEYSSVSPIDIFFPTC